MSIYRNGTQGGIKDVTGDNIESAPVDAANWDGRLEEVRTFDRALDASNRSAIVTNPVEEAPSAADFSADSGETVTRDVPARVTLTVMGPNGELVTAVAEGTATVTVTSTAVAVTAEVSGTGDVTVSA